MKKTSIISLIVVIAAVIFMAFTFQKTGNIKNSPNDYVTFDIVNCDDCPNLQYCIDGGPIQNNTSLNCTITVLVLPDPPIKHTICVVCGTKRGSATYDVSTGRMKIYVAEGNTCTCKGEGTKKNK
jgi:hypothetical protein